MKNTSPSLRPHGFTLMEIVVVMSIMTVIIGIGFTSFAVMDDEDPFEKTAQRLVQMSKYAHQSAVLRHRGMTVAFDKGGFGVLGAADGDGAYHPVPEGMKVFIMRLGGKSWEKAEGHLWGFGEQGICEPVKIRFETVDGARELAFHPLTGGSLD